MSITRLVASVAILAVALVAESVFDSSLAAWLVLGLLVVICGCVAALGVWSPSRPDAHE
jgi:hypothetical protein